MTNKTKTMDRRRELMKTCILKNISDGKTYSQTSIRDLTKISYYLLTELLDELKKANKVEKDISRFGTQVFWRIVK